MRPQQQNRRMRGRGNNRKGPNPLTRSYESNGPDVKIRGTAQQVADKYAALARDAQSSGDRVMAENYLQHAEHYNRIIAAAAAQLQPQQPVRERNDDFRNDDFDSDFDERDDETTSASSYHRPRSVDDGSGPQPVIEGTPAEVAYKEQQVNGSGRGKANGHTGANGNSEEAGAAPEAGAPKSEASSEAAEETAAPKPAKRTRRPRTRKSEDAAPSADAAEPSRSEEAAAQG